MYHKTNYKVISFTCGGNLEMYCSLVFSTMLQQTCFLKLSDSLIIFHVYSNYFLDPCTFYQKDQNFLGRNKKLKSDKI